jgi:hypothetical protein
VPNNVATSADIRGRTEQAGKTISWIVNVSDRESVAFLQRIADSGTDHAYNGALLALTLNPSGTDALIEIARHNPSGHVRGKALFWLWREGGVRHFTAAKRTIHPPARRSPQAQSQPRSAQEGRVLARPEE